MVGAAIKLGDNPVRMCVELARRLGGDATDQDSSKRHRPMVCKSMTVRRTLGFVIAETSQTGCKMELEMRDTRGGEETGFMEQGHDRN
ncbi:hypothetical protein CCHR01_10551 [Colletotrichum chrysophilum]|uniref:Uncharacterized protein n=1 Tax=Colletotrichum chrysophilum TaxID=1836956 RepID=A0AAD9AEP9_9PEZI|nr:hypothetical protein CCHR01_10551 [Colletotrichum chrysophilum]